MSLSALFISAQGGEGGGAAELIRICQHYLPKYDRTPVVSALSAGLTISFFFFPSKAVTPQTIVRVKMPLYLSL